MQVASGVKQAAMSVRVQKTDGRVIDYGAVSYWHRNPLRRLWYALGKRLGRSVTTAALFSAGKGE